MDMATRSTARYGNDAAAAANAVDSTTPSGSSSSASTSLRRGFASFSITAPRFTEEDEQAERAALTEEEINDITNDVLGLGEYQETTQMRRMGAIYVDEGLRMIQESEKVYYNKALRTNPGIVFTETEPIRFLRAFSYNPWDAALHLVKHWNFRMKLFGEDRFARPLTCTGHGALDQDAIELLEKGLLVRLPDDSHGRAVVYVDRARLITTSSTFRKTFLQVWMYLFCAIIDESESAQHNGIIVFLNFQGTPINKFDRKLSRTVLELLQLGLPLRVRAIHGCFSQRDAVRSEYLFPVVKFLLGKELRRRFVVHAGNSQEIVKSFTRYGISQSNLPLEFGGNLKVEDEFREWLARRRALETEREQNGYYDL